MTRNSIACAPLGFASLRRALHTGWRRFSLARNLCVSYALLFTVLGALLLGALEAATVTPMAIPLAGAFMLIGPILLVGYFAVGDALAERRTPRLVDILRAYREAPRQLWVLALVCALLFMIWLTDAATLYGFMVGRVPSGLAQLIAERSDVARFLMWSSLMGGGLAFIIYTVTVFSVPLLFYRRCALVGAVIASVRAVFSNLAVLLAWGGFLALSCIGAILLLPTFPLVFPVLALASHALYREAFPDGVSEWTP